jgi:hypothetical protein
MEKTEISEGSISEIKEDIEDLKRRVAELEEKPPTSPIAAFEELIKLLLVNIGKKLNIIKEKK